MRDSFKTKKNNDGGDDYIFICEVKKCGAPAYEIWNKSVGMLKCPTTITTSANQCSMYRKYTNKIHEIQAKISGFPLKSTSIHFKIFSIFF